MLTFVTGNESKFREACQILGMGLAKTSLKLSEVQSLSVEEVSIEKARSAFLKLRKPLIVEDTGLYINSLNGFPGALIRWFELVGYEKICSLLPEDGRSAYAETCVTFISENALETFVGRINGRIASSPRGSHNFGWDVIFEPEGCDSTFAELSESEKNKISMRRLALGKLKDYLDSNPNTYRSI
ncbi:non-canonical purine NTP pyrophosphatase [Candidatus Marsarchaeota archaeon]|nr:non-canonical purine NTP pyrophosphatase [Candidatus Marsarchaeota archaeon]